ncbi:spore coat protein U domain-containing protein [Serratia marcescens]|nr:spore coat protein U domain-containing protein [Serratia marcescens]MBH2766656.1 spore coat protein U domain-containing protein [Serratia marcescens]MBH2766716.1 spore coat protein U domain-containing protein [Serratia marcescens]
MNCWIQGAISMNFGPVYYTTSTSSVAGITYACNASYDSPKQTYHVRLCTFVNADPALPGIAPRELRHWDNSRMKYDFYSDAAHTQILGGAGDPFPVSSWSRDVQSNSQISGDLTLYGLVPAAQNALADGIYESHFQGGVLRWRWSRGNAAVPSGAECQANSGGEGGGEVNYFLNVVANAQDACFIRQATDLDFGSLVDLTTPHSQQGAIVVQCPLNTAWSLSLSPGLHAQGGSRRMQNTWGDSLTYGLYRDAAHTQPWETLSTGRAVSGVGAGMGTPVNVPVYGLISPQAVNSSGVYTDTVTVTLTY